MAERLNRVVYGVDGKLQMFVVKISTSINYCVVLFMYVLWSTRNEASFEEVRHNKASSYRQAEQSKMSSGQGPKLTLGNRYGTLSNENSS